MKHGRRQCLTIMALVASATCGPPPVDHHFMNEGQLCIYPSPQEQMLPLPDPMRRMFETNRPLPVAVTFPACMSGSCTKMPMAMCSVRLADGNVLDVTSEGSFRHEGSTCTLDCRRLVAKCETPALSPGTYRVRHGANEMTITVPSTMAIPCMGMTWR